MIHVFYGTDRVKAEQVIDQLLGENREVIDAENLLVSDIPSIFQGTTFFDNSRKILIRDFLANSSIAPEITKYLNTPHEVVLLEQKLDGRSATVKELKKEKSIDLREFNLPEKKVDKFLSFNVYDQALNNGAAAVKTLKAAEDSEDPYLMIGAWASKAIKNFSNNPSAKNKNALKELAKIDILLKSSRFSTNPWPILETYLLRLKNM